MLIISGRFAGRKFGGNCFRTSAVTLRNNYMTGLKRKSAAVRCAFLILASLLTVLPMVARDVVGWGAGTNIAKPPDFNDYGQSIVPVSLTNAMSIAAGWRHSLALLQNGKLNGWGDDALGQLDLPSGSNYIAISCGRLHSLALDSDGIVAASGDDFYGQIDVPTNLTGVIAVSAGFYHSLALTPDGKVVAWGMSTNDSSIGTDPNYGQSRNPASLSNVVAIAAGGW